MPVSGWLWHASHSWLLPMLSLHPDADQVKILHEDRPNGVVAFERVDGLERIVTVINAGQSSWQGGEYGAWVGGGSFQEVFSSQVCWQCRCSWPSMRTCYFCLLWG